ncbi:hypothetical protein F2Q70_00042997 [Brassica cretica]|uniref:Uncharacterized protein n=1 Tax=Brassica cretica TaxID=69181 RepID=A0A8S9KLI6_BRACR|nr:hypothetical protein F2Q70_00042997 [Brassica cretica]
MASTFTATSSIGSMVATKGHRSDNKLMNNLSSSSFGRRQNVFPRLRRSSPAIAGVNKLAYLVGVTLGPKGRNAVLESKHGSPRIVNDGVTVAREVELEDPVENIGAKLVRQAAAKTNDFAGDGTTTSVVLAQGFIAEGVKVVAAGANSVLITRGIEKTAKALVAELKKMLKTVSLQMWQLLVQVTMSRVGRKGVVTLEEGKSAENVLYVVEGMQFDRGYVSPYFVIDNEKMSVEFDNCKWQKMASTFTATSSIGSMVATKGHKSDNKLMNNLSSSSFGRRQNVFPKLRRSSPAIAGVNKLAYLVGVTLGPKGRNAVLESKHGSPRIVNDGITVAREVELEDPVENIGAKLVRQAAAKTNDLAGDGTTTSVVLAQVIFNLIIQVVAAGANSVLITRGIEKTAKALVAELKKMSKEVEDSELADVAAVSAGNNEQSGQERCGDTWRTVKCILIRMSIIRQAAVEEGIVVGGGCTLLRLASKVGADIVKRSLSYPLKLIAKNAGVNGSVVSEKVVLTGREPPHTILSVKSGMLEELSIIFIGTWEVLSNENVKFGYNAATGKYEDLMAAGIIDPTKLRLQRYSRCQTVLLLRSRSLSQFPQATQWTTQDMDTEEIGK